MTHPLVDWLPPRWRPFGAAVWERRVPVLSAVAGAAVVALVVAFLLPKWYTGQATVLPPTEGGDSFSIMAGLIESSALSKLGLLSTSSPSDVYVEILKSRTIREALIRQYDLQRSYKCRNLDLTLKELESHYTVDVSKAGVVLVNVEDRDPKRAADMANFAVAQLDDFNRRTYTTRARRTREFLEERLATVKTHLQKAEAAVMAYERSHKILTSDESSAVEGVASLIADKLSLQVKRSYVSGYSRADSPTLRQIDAEMEAIDREIGKLPGLKQEGTRLALDAGIQRKVFTLLTAQYEEAKIQEMKDTPSLAVLDVARTPQMKSRPRRLIIVAVATAAAAVLSLAWVGLSLRQSRAAWSARSTQTSAPTALSEIR
jgi:uncharacterized protein involved in exopolysaccharide biosynthesis